MSMVEGNPRIYLLSHSPIEQEISAFLIDRQARGLSPSTIEYFREKLATFRAYCIAQGVNSLYAITPRLVRSFLLELAKTHNPGGVHGHYRAARAFLNWWEAEVEPSGWRNPVAKVRAPKVRQDPLPSVVLEDLRAMLRTCKRKTFPGDRDRALLLFLPDTGVRRAEMSALNIEDVNVVTGTILIRRGKGGRSRTTFVGAKTKRALVAYLRHRAGVEDGEPLWVTVRGTRLSHAGLREIVRRRAQRAEVPAPSLHAFRRGFALLSLRAGVNIHSLQRMMGHSNASVLACYLALAADKAPPDHSTLTKFKNRLIKGGNWEALEEVYDGILGQAREQGVVLGSIQVVDGAHTVADVNNEKDRKRQEKQGKPPRDAGAQIVNKGKRRVVGPDGRETTKEIRYKGYKLIVLRTRPMFR